MRARWTLVAVAAALSFAAPLPALAAPCGSDILNEASVTLWSGNDTQIGYTLSYNVSSTVRIVCPITAINKYAVPTQVASGGAVTFYICVDNQRMSNDGSVWNMTVTDMLPAGLAMDQTSLVQMNTWTYFAPALAATDISYATNLAGPWTTWATPPTAGQAGPNFYIKWRIASVGVLKSACVGFRATVQ